LRSRVLAGRLAQLLARLRDVEDIVDHLKGESDIAAELSERFQLSGRAVRAHSAQPDAAAKQCRSLALMDVPKLLLLDPFALAFQVRDLAGDQLEGTRRARKLKNDVAMRIATPSLALRRNLKRLRQKGVTRKDRDAFTEYFVVCQFAAAVIVVIHRRQIVVDKRVGVNAFQRAR
jgi:hypothetical protein